MRTLLTLTLCTLSTLALADDETQVAEMAKAQGIEQCYEMLEKVSSFYIKDAAHGTHAVWNSNNADSRLYSTLTSRRYSDGNSHIEINATPNVEGSCDISFSETYALPNRCTRTQNEIFSSWTYSGMMDDRTVILTNDSGLSNVYLTPQGTDESICLVTRREVIFGDSD